MVARLISSVLSVLALLSTTVVADLTCKQYVPRGHVRSNSGVITFSEPYGNSNFPQCNLQVGNPSILNYANTNGTTFKFETCTSKSLGYAAFSDEGEGYDAGCPTYYSDYIRIISPVSGNCLTQKTNPNTNFTEIVPKKCNPNPTDSSQLFFANQEVLYDCFDNPPAYATYFQAGLYSIQGNGPDNDQEAYTPWAIASDNKTVYYYPDNGTYSQLVANIAVSK